MASPIFLSEPPKSFSTFAFLRGVQLALFSVGKTLRRCSIDQLFIITVTSVSINLISNLPTMILGTLMYTLALVNVISNTTSDHITNYWIDYQCHVLDLMTLSFSLILILFPSILTMFYDSMMEVDDKMSLRLKLTNYKSLFPSSKSKSSLLSISKSSYLIQLFNFLKKLPIKLPEIQLINELNLFKLIKTYLVDVMMVTSIHFMSKLPYIGSFVSPIITFSFIYPVCGFFMALLGTFVSIPSLLPRILIPCAPRRMFSMFKTPIAGDQYSPETSFINILPLILFLTTFRLLDFYLGVYFYKLPFTNNQIDHWIKSRSGILIGYIITIYIISSFLGPFGFIGIYTGVAGMGELISNVSTIPPKAVSLESLPERENDDDDEKIKRSYSSSRLIDMQRLSHWIEKETSTLVSKKQYLSDLIEDFNKFID